MKQVVQSINNGEILVIDAPPPDLQPGFILVQNAASLLSSGTERASQEFAAKNVFQKAKARPDLMKQFMDKVKKDGVVSAFDAVKSRLDQSMPLGYSSAGIVRAIGESVTEFKPGDRVACAGAGYANHAEVVCVPQNLVVRLPDEVDYETAAFNTLAAICLQGIRLADVGLGESVAVIGLGLLGQVTVQLLKAAGCVVIGMDLKEGRAELAEENGCDWVSITNDDFINITNYFTRGKGVDAVLITADTQSNEPVELAGKICRDKGTVVAVGNVGLEIPRRLYYEKELDFKISRSYGPGRYDSDYEEGGRDYPIAYVRWTENRNMQAFIQLAAEGKLNMKTLITHRFPVDQAVKAYDIITGRTDENYLGVLLTYDIEKSQESKVPIAVEQIPKAAVYPASAVVHPGSSVSVGLFGCGNFPNTILLPAMRKVEGLEFVAAYDPLSGHAQHTTQKFGFQYATADQSQILEDKAINVLVVATRHHYHAAQVILGLKAGKHVFCEKPPCLNEGELAEIIKVHNELSQVNSTDTNPPSSPFIKGGERGIFMVGYNRRFAPMVIELKSFFQNVQEPLAVNYRINAGPIPLKHWIQDPKEGGGRIIGEVGHFVDMITYLVHARPVKVYARSLPNEGRYHDDNAVITIEYQNGALGSIVYLANGDTSFAKERIEVFGAGRTATLDNFRTLQLSTGGRKKTRRSLTKQDKGHTAEWRAFSAAIMKGQPSPIPFWEIASASRVTFGILESLRSGNTISII
jgi:predicted dehydrogenase/threonine dehydrogenase-like Zn-dependent dehydrogenase